MQKIVKKYSHYCLVGNQFKLFVFSKFRVKSLKSSLCETLCKLCDLRYQKKLRQNIFCFYHLHTIKFKYLFIKFNFLSGGLLKALT